MMRTFGFRALVFALCAIAFGPAVDAAPASPSQACASAPYRQFDFWRGSWRVTDRATRQFQGTNDVTSEYNGCTLQEHWKGSDGSAGTSLNAYDASRKIWHQTWISSGGQLIVLEGGLQNGSMVLSGRGIGKRGPYVQRIVWTKRPDGSVRQHWQVRGSNAKAWRDVFDGIYRRA